MKRHHAFLVILAAALVGTPAAKRPYTSDVDEVWAMEDSYWRFVKAGDVCGADAPRS